MHAAATRTAPVGGRRAGPAPPFTSAYMAAVWSSGTGGRRQSAQKIEHGVTDREVPDLHEAVAVGPDIEIPRATPAQWIVGRKSAHRRDRAAGGGRRVDRIEDVGRAPRAADGDHEIARARVQLDLLGEYAVVAEIVAEAGEHAGVVQGERADPAVLGVVGRHVARDGGAAAVSDEDQLVARLSPTAAGLWRRAALPPPRGFSPGWSSRPSGSRSIRRRIRPRARA